MENDMASEITVLIADDHPIFRKGLREILESEPSLRLVGEAEDGMRALAMLRDLRPQVAVLDVDMPQLDGISVARAVQQENLSTAIVLLTMHRHEHFFNAALDLGVRGYVLKDSAVSDVVAAIRAASTGQRFVTPLLTDYLLNRYQAQAAKPPTGLAALTDAERRILKMIAQYKSSQEIADELFISVRTVDAHRANIANKLDLKGARALLRFALEHQGQL
jgi:DNA-binding NarL/FixJ family response regulator